MAQTDPAISKRSLSPRAFSRLTVSLQMLTNAASGQAGEALDTKRIVAAWLLAGVVPFTLVAALSRVAPLAAAEYGLSVVVSLDVCAVLFFFWTWPHVFALSRLRPRVSDVAFGALGGYLCYNVQLLIPDLPIAWPWAASLTTGLSRSHLEILFVCHVLVVPLAEEMVSRGVILASLCRKMPIPWAVLITSVAATVLHLPPSRWSRVFVAWLIFCGIYLVRGRSLPASIAAHVVTNALCWFPSIVLTGYLLK